MSHDHFITYDKVERQPTDHQEMSHEEDALFGDVVTDTECQLNYQEQVGGSVRAAQPGRFEFNLNPYVDRRSERLGVRERHYTANLRQVGQFIPPQNLNIALVDSIHRTLQNLILCDRVPDQDRVFFSLASNRLNNSYNYWGLPAAKWLRGGERVDQILQQMARMFNSNENFEMNDSFQLSFTHVRAAPRGSGRKRKLKPGNSNLETFRRFKQEQGSIVLCTSYSHCQGKPYNKASPTTMRDGMPVQTIPIIVQRVYKQNVPTTRKVNGRTVSFPSLQFLQASLSRWNMPSKPPDPIVQWSTCRRQTCQCVHTASQVFRMPEAFSGAQGTERTYLRLRRMSLFQKVRGGCHPQVLHSESQITC